MTNAEIKEFADRNDCDFAFLIGPDIGVIRNRRSGNAFSFSCMPRDRNGLSNQLAYQMQKLKEGET